MELPTSESQVLILKELHRADTVAYFRTDVNNLLARFVAQSHHGCMPQRRQRDAPAQQHVNGAAWAQGIEALGQRLPPTVDPLTFAQRRPLVEWLLERVIVNDTQVDIRSVVPTGPTGETTPVCHLRLDYLDAEALCIQATGVLGWSHIADHIQRLVIPLGPTTPHHDGTIRLSCAVDLF